MAEPHDDPALSAPQARVLGCLIEKEATTPDAYPLTLNALRAACNQSTNRDPVVDFGPELVENTLHALKAKGFVRFVHPGRGERATKFRHVAGERLGLGPAELALVALLLLRGPQSAGELRTRSERLHRFEGAAEVETTLRSLAGLNPPLATSSPPKRGQRDKRWVALLEAGSADRLESETHRQAPPERGGLPAASPVPPAPTAPTEDGVEELTRRVAALEAQMQRVLAELGDLLEPSTPDNTD